MTKRKEIPTENSENSEKKVKIDLDTELEVYIGWKNWELSNHVDYQAYEKAFPNKEERLEFLKNLKQYQEAKITEYSLIEKNFPKNRNHKYYYKIQDWRKKIFSGPKRGATMGIQRIEEVIEDLESEFFFFKFGSHATTF
jgi:hypothetical protein